MEHKIEYVENDLVRIAKRENNMRRKYLVVNPLQGKHVPVVPSKALKLFTDLADVFRNEYKNEKLLLVGFAQRDSYFYITKCLAANKVNNKDIIQKAARPHTFSYVNRAALHVLFMIYLSSITL